MNNDNLIRMANKIGDFFIAMPNAAEGRAGIANHLAKFWESRMLRSFFAHLDAHAAAGTDAGLSPILLETVTEYRASLMPKPA